MEKKGEVRTAQQFSGFIQILIKSGLSLAIATAINAALQEDEKIVDLIKQDKSPLIFMTQMDSKVDDKICLPLEGTVWDEDDPNRPHIPGSLHPNCRCYWVDAINGRFLGQI